jgi:transient receptor potential cation channel subfamily V member 6
MIYSMVTGDMMTFAIIYTVFLLGFSQAIFYLHKGHPDVPVSFENYLSTWMGLFHWTLGTYNVSDSFIPFKAHSITTSISAHSTTL